MIISGSKVKGKWVSGGLEQDWCCGVNKSNVAVSVTLAVADDEDGEEAKKESLRRESGRVRYLNLNMT